MQVSRFQGFSSPSFGRANRNVAARNDSYSDPGGYKADRKVGWRLGLASAVGAGAILASGGGAFALLPAIPLISGWGHNLITSIQNRNENAQRSSVTVPSSLERQPSKADAEKQYATSA